MAYNKYKLSDLSDKLGIRTIQQSWLPKSLPAFETDHLLSEHLLIAEQAALYSEKARSEWIIAPTLHALYRQYIGKMSLFPGYEFNVERQLSLQGYCDYIFSSHPNSLQIAAPAMLVVEAKRLEPDLDDFGQCGAEMYAAQLFNE